MVRRPRLVAARASTRATSKGAGGSLGAADRTNRRRQDAGRIFADIGGVVAFGGSFIGGYSISGFLIWSFLIWSFLIDAALFSPPSAERRGWVGGGGCFRRFSARFKTRARGATPHPRPRERALLASD